MNPYAREKLQTMRVFGADLEVVPSQDGKITPDLIQRLIKLAREFAESEPSYFTDQLHNTDSLKGYEHIGQELTEQVEGPINAFCGGVGTAGMLMGVAHILRGITPTPRIVALEPSSSPVVSRGLTGTHHIEGVGIGFVPPLLDKVFFDEAREIDEVEARQMAWRLAREEGIFAGTSTGMNVVGAIALAKELGAGHIVVTVAVDSGLKYLAGDLFSEEHF